MTKILAMSNIHGRYDEMVEIFKEIQKEYSLSEFDKIVFLGDYIAYGKKNKEVIKLLINLKSKYENVVLLKGNWEDILYQVERLEDQEYKKEAFKFFAKFGQVEMLKELRMDKNLLNMWLDEIERMPLVHIEDDYLFSHAGPNLSEWGSKTDIEKFFKNVHNPIDFVWSISNHIEYMAYWALTTITDEKTYPRFPFKIVFGQTAINKLYREDKSMKYDSPFHIGDAFGIDFGALYTKGRLGTVIFDGNGTKTYAVDVNQISKIIVKPNNMETQENIKEPNLEEKKMSVAKPNNVFKNKQFNNKAIKNPLEATWELYEKGLSVKEIAKERDVLEATIEVNLFQLYKKGKNIEIEKFFNKNNESIVIEAIQKHLHGGIVKIKQNLPREISYTEIRAIGVKNKLL